MGREETLAWATGQMVVPFTEIGNTGEGPEGGKEGQLINSRLKIMESKLFVRQTSKKAGLIYSWESIQRTG